MATPITPVPAHNLPVEYMIGPMRYQGTLAGRPVSGFGVFEFYRRQSEAVAALAAPSPAETALTAAVKQRPADYVLVRIPTDAATIMGINGSSYATEIIDGERVCWVGCSVLSATFSRLVAGSSVSPLRLVWARLDRQWSLAPRPVQRGVLRGRDIWRP